jgi:hypothetical protein
MALVGHISGSSQSNSVIGISGSVIVANRPNASFPAFPGSDISFYVSGSTNGRVEGSNVSVFGGQLVVSGASYLEGGLYATTISGSGNLDVGGDLTVAGDIRINGNDIKSSTGQTAITLNDTSVIIPGDLTINGTTVTVNTTNLEVKDALIGLGFSSGSVAEANGDRGFIGGLSSGDDVSMFWDNSASEFAVVKTNSTPGNNTVNITSYAQFHALGLTGSLTKLSDGTTDYLFGGSNISLTTGSNGQVTIDVTGLSGYVVGPASTTNDAIAVYDGTTGKLIKNSNLLIGTRTSTQAVVTASVNLTDYGLALIPNGTGSLMASAPDGTPTGGDARGQWAVDFQMYRGNAYEVASGNNSVIGGGGQNTASGNASVIAGGTGNFATAQWATVGGGFGNQVYSDYGTVVGGISNRVDPDSVRSTVGGGDSNIASGSVATIAGGYNNQTRGDYSTIGGGRNNSTFGMDATIAGGFYNDAQGDFSAVGGGRENDAWGYYSTVAGGYENKVTSGQGSTIAGGVGNLANYPYVSIGGGLYNAGSQTGATIAGGESNLGGGQWSSIGGGIYNTASSDYTTVGGGYQNISFSPYSVIAGGSNNTSNLASHSSIGGGYNNNVSAGYTTICGGLNNNATAQYASVGGGFDNDAYAEYANVGGGGLNVASGTYSTVAGGGGNSTLSQYATVGGGSSNNVPGSFATVSGGGSNYASGTFSTIGGGGNNSTYTTHTTVGGGSYNIASGTYSTVIGGLHNQAYSYGETVAGVYATIGGGDALSYVSTDRLFVVGNGTGAGASERSNALTLLKNGNLHLSGTLTLMSGSTSGITFPTTRGTNGQVLTSDGAGLITWQTPVSQPSYFTSTTAGSIYTTGSAAFIGNEVGIDAPSDKGSDVSFYVSGSTDGSSIALFGGGIVTSGSLSVFGNTTLGDTTSDLITFNARAGTDFLPANDNQYNLGSATNRWANVYTGDLHLRNDRGDWTVIEEDEYLSIRNNKTGKLYKFVMEPVGE